MCWWRNTFSSIDGVSFLLLVDAVKWEQELSCVSKPVIALIACQSSYPATACPKSRLQLAAVHFLTSNLLWKDSSLQCSTTLMVCTSILSKIARQHRELARADMIFLSRNVRVALQIKHSWRLFAGVLSSFSTSSKFSPQRVLIWLWLVSQIYVKNLLMCGLSHKHQEYTT